MVTLPLERMASRVAASLCYATGLGPEMVVNSQVSASPLSCRQIDCKAPLTILLPDMKTKKWSAKYACITS